MAVQKILFATYSVFYQIFWKYIYHNSSKCHLKKQCKNYKLKYRCIYIVKIIKLTILAALSPKLVHVSMTNYFKDIKFTAWKKINISYLSYTGWLCYIQYGHFFLIIRSNKHACCTLNRYDFRFFIQFDAYITIWTVFLATT